MDYDQLGQKGSSPASSSANHSSLVSSGVGGGGAAGASLFNTSGKGEVQREWRSATDGSVITSSAKVGIAVAQQRAPPETSSYFSNQTQSSGGGNTSLIGGTSSTTSGLMGANSAAAAAAVVAGQTALDLNSFQQLYSQAVAGLPLSVPAANLQPAIPFPVAYWPPMQIPTAAAAVQYQALGNILRSSSATLNSAAAAAAYPSLLQPTTLAALGAAAGLPASSTASNLEPLLGVAAAAAANANNSQIRSTTDWNDNPLLVSSGSLQTSADLNNLSSINTAPALLQQTINSVSGSVVPELGKVYAYPRKQCDTSESPVGTSGGANDIAASVGSTSSFGKTIGFVRKPKPFPENASVFTNRELIKSDAPKINLPTRSLTIPTSSYDSRSSSPIHSPSSQLVSQNSHHTPTPPPAPVQTPPMQTIPTQLPSDVHLPPKMRGKAAQQQMADSVLRGVNKLENNLREVREISSVSPPVQGIERPRNVFEQTKYEPALKNELHQQDQLLEMQQHQQQQQREQEEQRSTGAVFDCKKVKPPETQIIGDETAQTQAQALRLQRALFEESAINHRVSPPAPARFPTDRERCKENVFSGGCMDNYMKCMENVIVQYQKHAEEGRLAEFSELCKRASDQDYAHLGRLSPSVVGMGYNKAPSKMHQKQQPQDIMSSSTHFGLGSSSSSHQHSQAHNSSGASNRSSLTRQQQSNFVYDSLEFSPTSTSSQMQQPLLQARLSTPHKTSTIQDRDHLSSLSSAHHHGGLLPFKAREDVRPTVISDDDDYDEDDDDESVSSDSTICPESPPLVISYTKDTLNEFCTRQYQSLLDDVEQPLKQVLASEDEDTAAKRKLIVLEQRVKRKLKMKFAGFDSEAKRAKLEAAASAVAAGSSSYSSLSRMSELSALGSPSGTPATGAATGTTNVTSSSLSASDSTHTSSSSSGVTVGVGMATPHKYDLPMSSSTPLADAKHIQQQTQPLQTTPRNKPTVSRVLQRKNTPSPGSSQTNQLRHPEMDSNNSSSNSNSSHSTYLQQQKSHSHAHSQHQPMTHPSSHSTYTAKGGGGGVVHANAPHYGSSGHSVGTGMHGQGMEALKVCTTDSRRSVHLSTDDLVSGQRVLLRQTDGLYAPGKLIAMQPPDIYGILVDGARGAKPQMFPYEELVRKAVLEIVPRNKGAIPKGTKVCAYFNRSFTVLHPGTVSFSSTKTLPHAIKIEFDDGEEAIVNLSEVRILSSLFNPMDYTILTPVYSPDSRCTSSFNTSSTSNNAHGGTTSGAASRLRNRNKKVVSIWRWDQKCLKETPLSKNIKAFYSSIKKADGQVYKDDFVAFHNSAPNSAMRRPYIGKVINFFETAAGENFVKVSWYYHTEETKQGINTALPKNALLRSNHTDELHIQTISQKVEVLDQAEYMKFNQNIYMAAQSKGTSPDHLFVCAGTYDYIKGVTSLTFKKCSSSPSYSSIASTSSASPSSSHFDPTGVDSLSSSVTSRSNQQQVNLPLSETPASSFSSSTTRLQLRQHSNLEMKDRASSSRMKPC